MTREQMVKVVTLAGVDNFTANSIVSDLIAASGGPDHIVKVDDRNNMTMQHPITERFNPDPREQAHLFKCNVFQLARIAQGQGAFTRQSMHRAWVDRGVLMTEEV